MSEITVNTDSVEQYKEITDEIALKFLEIKNIINSISFSNATEEVSGLGDIVSKLSATLDTMSSFTILTNFKFGEDLGKKIVNQIDGIKFPKLEPQVGYMKWRLKDETNFMYFKSKLTKLSTIDGKIQLDGGSKINKLLGTLDKTHTGSRKIFDAMNAGISGIIPTFQLLTATAGEFLISMLTSPVTWMILGIALAVMVVIEAFKRLSTSSNEDIQFLMTGIKAVGDFVMGLGSIIFNFLVGVVMMLVGRVAAVVGFVRRMFNGVDFFENIKITFKNFIGSMLESFSGLIKAIDKVFGSSFYEDLNIQATIDESKAKSPQTIASTQVTTEQNDISNYGEIVGQTQMDTTSYDPTILEGMTGTDMSNMESQLNPITDVILTPTNETFDTSIYGNETKETMIEKLTVNAESVYFISEKEYQEIEKNQTITTPNESGSNALDPNTVTDSGKNNDKLIRDLAQTIYLTPAFNFTGDIRIDEDLQTISNYILSKLKADCYNGSNVTQNFVGAGHGHFGKAASWIAIKQGIYAY